MAAPRLTAGVWVAAHLRRCQVAGLAVYVVRRGDETAGSVAIKLNRLDGTAMVLTRTYLENGEAGWMRAGGVDALPEADADAYLARQIGYDPDLWVIEIEDRDGRHALDEPVV